MPLKQSLQKIGLSEIDSEVYLALLKVPGAQPASIIANRIGFNRTTTYKSLLFLAKKGLATKTMKHGIICFFAESPEEKLVQVLDEKKQALEEANEVILKALPGLTLGEDASSYLPKIRYYEGVEGIKQIYELVLKEGEDYYRYGDTTKIYEALGEYTDVYIKKRKKQGIAVRAIMPYHKSKVKLYKKDKEELREAFYIPYDLFSIEGEIRIFGDKVGIISLKKESLIGVVIQSDIIAKMFKAIFMLTWKDNKKIFKPK